MPLLIGPAQKLPLEQFDLTVSPPIFEKLAAANSAGLDAIDAQLADAVSVFTDGADADIAVIDSIGDELAGIQSEADLIGVLDESGILDPIAAAAVDIDSSPPQV